MTKTMRRLFSRAALLLLTMMLTTATAWADNVVTLSVDGDIPDGTAGHYYVNMPTEGDDNTLTITEQDIADGKGTFKFYDDGGKSGNYSARNSWLTITVPAGYTINLTGSISISSYNEFYMWDADANGNAGTKRISSNSSDTGAVQITDGSCPNLDITSAGNSVIFYFDRGEDVGTGWDITVTLIDNSVHALSVASATGGTMTASGTGVTATTGKVDQTVTLTATPDEGNVLAGVNVNSTAGAVEVDWDVWTNSATFTMPAADVTVTPVFAAEDDRFAIIPATGTHTLTIPDGVTSFKVYDDGGATGDYSANCDGWLELNLPSGYKFHLAGTITTDATTGDRLSIYRADKNHERERERSDAAGVAKEFSYDYDADVLLRFISNDENQYAGLDLTVSLVGNEYAVTVNNPDGVGGSVVTASVGGTAATTATAGQTVTLTSAPAEGYVLGALSVRDADGNIVDVTGDMLWYTDATTATFTMPASAVTVTPVFTSVMTAAAGLTVNMPKKNVRNVTIHEGVTSFKVYDYGGADCNYLGEQGQRLCLTAPAGCALQLEGTVATKGGGATTFTVLDGPGNDTDDYLVNHAASATDGAEVSIPAVVSTGQSIYLNLLTSDAADTYASLDLTVTVITGGVDHSVTVADATGGTMTASTAAAPLGQTVTLTATPADGNLLSGLSVTTGGRAVKTDWNVWTNSATFTMPAGDVTVTPTFTSDLTGLAVCLPVKGFKYATIPEGVASFKIYDDGGASGDYTPYCDGNIIMTVAEGSHLRITGSVTGPEDKFGMTIDNTKFTATTTDIDITSTATTTRVGLASTINADTGAGLDLTATVLYAVTIGSGTANGTVATDKANAAAGETVTLSVTPAEDCTVGTVTVNGQPLAAVQGVYSFQMPARRVSVSATFRKLLTNADIAISDIPAQQYNGTALTPVLTVSDGQTPLTQGTDYTVSPESVTDADTYTVTLTGIGAYDGTTTREFTVSRRAVTLTSASDEKTYDGTALTADGVTVGGDGFAQGEGATYSVTGTQTDAGSSANTFTYTLNDGTKAANYDITTTEGTLTVAPASVTLTALSRDTDIYDGTEKTVSGFTSSVDGLTFTGVTATGSGTDAGTYDVTFTGVEAGITRDDSGNYIVTATTDGTLTISYVAATLADNADNTDAIADIITNYGSKADVTLQGRTLYKDGKWNTLVLPFALGSLTGTPLDGAVVKTLVSSDFEGATLTMNFTEDKDNLTSIAAGVPYIVKWQRPTDYVAYDPAQGNADECSDIVAPTFRGVTISTATANVSTDYVDFIGTYSPEVIYESGDKHNLYLGNGNTLYYPTTEGFALKSCRAYFKLNGLTAGEPSSPSNVRAFSLNFGDEATGIVSIGNGQLTIDNEADAWYSLGGVRLGGKPTQKGVYINNGRKVVIK